MQLSKSSKQQDRIDALIIPFWKEKKKGQIAIKEKEFQSLYKPVVESGDFSGEEGEIFLLHTGKKKAPRLFLLGLGEEKESSLDGMRRSYAEVIKVAMDKKIQALSVFAPDCEEDFWHALCEGMLLANYTYDSLKKESVKKKKKHLVKKAYLEGISADSFARCKRVQTIMEGVNLTKDLIHGNADDITPQALAAEGKKLASSYEAVKTKVLSKKQLEKEGLHLLLAVGKGSAIDPELVIIEYRGDPSSNEWSSIIGKGITYDTGGLNLKPTGYMEDMKVDMSGAATVLGTIKAAAALKLKTNILGVVPATENAIGSRSYKPGDVYSSFKGITVEIGNTDAEGRLILADALAYVEENYKPKRMIDFATLTGAVVIALGEECTGLFSNDDALSEALVASGERTFERVWRMPIYKEYRKLIDSSIADIKNCGGRPASSITAALFLKEFVKKTPWAHLDIAGTSYISKPEGYHTTLATGVGVRLLIDFFEHLD